jgi:hypothetical protein
VQQWPADANTRLKRKLRVHFKSILDKADTPKRMPIRGFNRYTELLQNRNGVGHEALTTRFVDGRFHAIGYRNIKPSLPRGDSGSKTCGSSTDDKHVRCLPHSCS